MSLGSLLRILYWNCLCIWRVVYYCLYHQCTIKLSITTRCGGIGLPLTNYSTKLRKMHKNASMNIKNQSLKSKPE